MTYIMTELLEAYVILKNNFASLRHQFTWLDKKPCSENHGCTTQVKHYL